MVTLQLTKTQIQEEIKKVKKIISSLETCILDKNIDIKTRNEYKAEHSRSNVYLYKLLTY
jgi:hypothetical protein